MHSTVSGDYGIVADNAVTGKAGVADHHDVVSDLAVMCDVRPHHKKTIVADLGDEISFCRPDIDRYIFADDATGPNIEPARRTGASSDLTLLTNRCERKNLGVIADCGFTFHDNVLVQANPPTQENPGTNYAICTDCYVVGYSALNLSGNMNRCQEKRLIGMRR